MDEPIPDAAYFLRAYAGAEPESPAWFGTAIGQAPRRSLFACGDAEIELLTWGDPARPGLLFLHGNRAHADWWSFIAPFFAADWHCAAISFSGMGGSGQRAEQSSMHQFIPEAHAALAAAGMQRPVLIGHSMGASVGLHAATDNDLFSGLILIDSPVVRDPMSLRYPDMSMARPQREPRPFASLADGLARFRLSPPQPCLNPFIGDFIARRALEERGGAWHWRFDPRGLAMTAAQLPVRPELVRCPIAYLYGDRSALLTPEWLAETRQLLPAGTPLIAIPDAAHHVPVDQPLALVAALRAVLAGWQSRSGAGVSTL